MEFAIYDKPVICVDLDGVLAVDDGWQGVEVFGDPVPGSAALMTVLRRRWTAVIWTCRTNPQLAETRESERRLVNRVECWLQQHGIPYDGVVKAGGKPLAAAYLDDRGLHCRPRITAAGRATWGMDEIQDLEMQLIRRVASVRWEQAQRNAAGAQIWPKTVVNDG